MPPVQAADGQLKRADPMVSAAEVGQLVVAAVVPTEGSAPTEASLQAALRERLSSYKVPRRILVISPEEVLWTPSNKVKLAEMAQMIATRLGR